VSIDRLRSLHDGATRSASSIHHRSAIGGRSVRHSTNRNEFEESRGMHSTALQSMCCALIGCRSHQPTRIDHVRRTGDRGGIGLAGRRAAMPNHALMRPSIWSWIDVPEPLHSCDQLSGQSVDPTPELGHLSSLRPIHLPPTVRLDATRSSLCLWHLIARSIQHLSADAIAC
jgi:hypothetical protein